MAVKGVLATRTNFIKERITFDLLLHLDSLAVVLSQESRAPVPIVEKYTEKLNGPIHSLIQNLVESNQYVESN